MLLEFEFFAAVLNCSLRIRRLGWLWLNSQSTALQLYSSTALQLSPASRDTPVVLIAPLAVPGASVAAGAVPVTALDLDQVSGSGVAADQGRLRPLPLTRLKLVDVRRSGPDRKICSD